MTKPLICTLLIIFVPLAIIVNAHAQNQAIIGKWKTIDDSTNQPKAIVQIFENQGKYYGKIIELFRKSGEDPDPYAWPSGHNAEEEAQKTLFSTLRTTNGVLLIDNIEGRIKSAALSVILTKPTYTDRVLGESRSVAVPTNVLTMLSGNNVSVVGDLNRRVLRCMIDPGMERPDTRLFTFDPLTMVKQRRISMTRAALVLLQAYRRLGVSIADGSTASFESWDRIVRQTVCWLADLSPGAGLADPNKSLDVGFNNDPERDQLHELLTAWHGVYEARPVRIKEIRRRLKGMKSGNGTPEDITLYEVCMDIAGGRDGEIDAQRLRGAIVRFADRIVGDMVLSRSRVDRNNGDLWFVHGGEVKALHVVRF